MAATIISTLAAPSGLLTALDKKATAQGRSRAQLLAKAGLTQTDWDDLSTALGAANAANVNKLLNASNALLAIVASTVQVPENADGTATAISQGSKYSSHHGDLT